MVDESWLSWRVSRALEVLDAPHREVIELAYFGGLSQRDIQAKRHAPWHRQEQNEECLPEIAQGACARGYSAGGHQMRCAEVHPSLQPSSRAG
jgi:hypothetical protein